MSTAIEKEKKKRHFWADSADSINKVGNLGPRRLTGSRGGVGGRETPECVGVGRSACDRPSALGAQEAAGLGREIWRRVGAVDLGVALAAGRAT